VLEKQIKHEVLLGEHNKHKEHPPVKRELNATSQDDL
jgi:hypothetical protein